MIPDIPEPAIPDRGSEANTSRDLEATTEVNRSAHRTGPEDAKRTYRSYFGAVRGNLGAHDSPETADRYVQELRHAW